MMADLPPLPGDRRPARAALGPRPRRRRPAAGRLATDRERFRDPRTNRVMRVWVDAAGARHYVADDEQLTGCRCAPRWQARRLQPRPPPNSAA